MTDKLEKHLARIDASRRSVVEKLVIGSGFVPPEIVGFGMSSSATNDVGPLVPNSTIEWDGEQARRVAGTRS